MRGYAACLAFLALLGACDAPDGAADRIPESGIPVNDPDTFRADVNPDRAYAGEWAATRNLCENEDKVWTIETKRMAIEAARFCAFENVYVSRAPDGDTTWSTSARCLAEGRESHDFLFFRVEDNLREMRVTFNDSRSVELVRCPMKS